MTAAEISAKVAELKELYALFEEPLPSDAEFEIIAVRQLREEREARERLEKWAAEHKDEIERNRREAEFIELESSVFFAGPDAAEKYAQMRRDIMGEYAE